MFFKFLRIQKKFQCGVFGIYFKDHRNGGMILLKKKIPARVGKSMDNREGERERYSRKLLPTPGSSAIQLIPFCCKILGSPIPECSRISGVLSDPVAMHLFVKHSI